MIKIISVLLALSQFVVGLCFGLNNNSNVKEYFQYIDYAKNINEELDTKIKNVDDVYSLIKDYYKDDEIVMEDSDHICKVEIKGKTDYFYVISFTDIQSHVLFMENVLSTDYFVDILFSSNISLVASEKSSCELLLHFFGINNINYRYSNENESNVTEINADLSLYKLSRYCHNNGYEIICDSKLSDEALMVTYVIITNEGYTIVYPNYHKPSYFNERATHYKKIYIYNNMTIITDTNLWDNIDEYISYI